MKKINVFILSSFFLLSVFSCKEKATEMTEFKEAAPEVVIDESTGERVFTAGNFFTPDYRPYEPEKQSLPGKLKLPSAKKSRGEKSESIIPGLRKLSEYKTRYNTKKIENLVKEIGRDEPTAKTALANDMPFTVSDWGPKEAIPAEVRFPSFYVLFSEPVVPLSALNQEKDASDFMTIEPPVKGLFRWNGTSLLSFDCTEAVNPLQIYTIRVADGVKSLSGKEISGERAFKTKAAPLKVIWSAAGYSKNKWIDQNEVPPEFSREFRLQFNYPVKAEEIKKISRVTFDGKERPFSVKQEMLDTLTYEWEEKPDFDCQVLVTVRPENAGEEGGTSASFHTVSPFSYEYNDTGFTYGKYTNPVRIYFSQPIDEKSALEALSAKNDKGQAMPVTKENIEVSGQTLKVFGLPVSFHSKYSLEISRALKDIYGRNLSIQGDDKIGLSIEVPGAESKASFTDSGVKMLESAFPHKMVFEYQNIIDGSYLVRESQQPYSVEGNLGAKSTIEESTGGEKVELKRKPRDERLFEQVNFDKYLKNGKGWVEFLASIRLPRKPTKWNPEKEYKVENRTSVQVTNLGVTVRYGMNKVVAMVTNLSDGKALEGAEVWAGRYYKDKNISPDFIKENFHKAVTDKNGLAVISLSEENAKDVISGEYWDAPLIYAQKDDDKILFRPDDHAPWRSGIYSYSSVPNQVKAEKRIFMFSDRGLYKPGEKVSFRGIDRDQILGSFLPYQGNYVVTLKEDKWRNPKEYGILKGQCSESGGFFGSFELPEDIEPGIYKISYSRGEDSGKADEEMRINVAFFERLKFQSEIAMPQTPIIAGEKIQASLSSSYLAGGAMASASYESNWFKEPWYFTSSEAEFNQYKFGPENSSDGRSHIREDTGSLDAKGNAILSCETSSSSIKGAPYRYRVSAEVTDVSNQLVSTAAATVVHPASFYVGLLKGETASAFAKKDEKLTFSYKLALPDGKAISDERTKELLAGKDKKLSVKLTREEWNLVQQQGISDIYSRYEKTDVTESEESLSLNSEGKITVTPKEAGYHRLQVSCTDKAGRSVITEYEFFVTGGGRFSWNQYDATSLRLTPDKNMYNPGETAHILMESSLPEGNYLITVEREGIFTEEVRHLDGSIHVIDIPVARNYLPVFYVSISSYSVRSGQPKHEYGEADLDKPKGFYGAATLFVNPRVKSFSIAVENAKPSYRPGEEAEVTLLATKGGKPLANAELTLMAVDRGVLDLINYHVPDPIDFYYNTNNFPLRVKGGDSREYLMDPVTYEVKNLKGGDSGEDEKMSERSDFNPTAIFEPMLKTDENGRVKAKFKLPDTLTTYRITVFGVNGENLALQEDEIAVQNPINVQQVLPRQLRERDTSEVGVLVSNLDDKSHDVSVSLSLGKLENIEDKNGLAEKEGEAFVDGEAEHTIRLPSGANATVYFDFAAKKAGKISLEFTVKSDILNERLVTPLKIEKPYIYETVTTIGQLNDKEESATESVVIPSFARGNGSLTVTLDTSRLGLLGEAVNYLFDYPYGCLEQQSSRILPLVIFEDYIDAFNLENQVTDIKKFVRSNFKRWEKLQHEDGGFGYWESSLKSDFFVSQRIAHIYALAIQRGYKAKELGIDIDKLCAYIQKECQSEEKKASLLIKSKAENERINLFYGDYTMAYSYYILALNGIETNEEKIAEIISREGQDTAALALAGLASLESKKAKTALAKEAAKKIRSYIRPTARGVDITNPKAPKWAFAYYGDQAENLALSLELFTRLDKDDDMNTRLIHSLMANQRSGYWKNTVTTARVLESIYSVIKAMNLDKTNLKANAIFNKEEIARGEFKGASSKPVTLSLPFSDEKIAKAEKDRELSLEFTKKGKGQLYYTATMSYSLPEEMQEPRDSGLGLTMRLYDNATGEEIKMNGESSLMELESGKCYRVCLTLSSSYDRSFIALRVPVPSGSEILDATFVTSPDSANSSSGNDEYSEDYDDYAGYFYGGDHYMSNQAIYNSEIQYFWDSFGKGKTSAEFKFRAVRRGVFPTPPVKAECMYKPEVFGRTGGILYTIK